MCTPSEICENGEIGENSENGLDLWLGGGVCTPSENCENGENGENSDLLAHKMSKLPIFSKRPLQYPKKAVTSTNNRNFGLLPSVFCIFSYL